MRTIFRPKPPRTFPVLMTLELCLSLGGGLAAPLWAHECPEGPYLHTSHDCITDPSDERYYGPVVRSTRDGDWADAQAWDVGRPPNRDEVVLLTHAMSYGAMDGAAKAIGIKGGGRLSFRPDRDTRLTVGTIVVKSGGALEVGTPRSPVDPRFRAEIVIADQPLDKDAYL